MDIPVLFVAFPDGLFLGHGLVVEAVDEGLIAVNFIAALVQLPQIRAQKMTDGAVQTAAHAQITR